VIDFPPSNTCLLYTALIFDIATHLGGLFRHQERAKAVEDFLLNPDKQVIKHENLKTFMMGWRF
jgi:hypothetical protein